MQNTKPFILFITGISGSGKTFLYEELRQNQKYKNISFHDIDENGVPGVGRHHWRPFRVEELFSNAVKEYTLGKSSVICGISVPSEILDSEYYHPSLKVHFLLLDVPVKTFRERIKKRLEDSNDLAELEMHTNRLKKRLINEVLSLKNGHKIETGSKGKEEMVKTAEALIDGIMRNN